MIKSLMRIAATAALLLPFAASAQSQQPTVTVYGVADVFLEHGEAGTQASPTHMTRVESGGLNGSRVGLRASEDLGGGLKASVVLEHGLFVDSGQIVSAPTTFWNRQSFVGLSGTFGSLSAGRQYSPLLVHQDSFDTSLSTTGYGSPYNSGVMRTVSRVNNSVLYTTPAGDSFSASLMAAAGEGAGGRTLSASVREADGPLALGAAWLRVGRPDSSREAKTILNLAASYRFGDATIAGALQRTSNDSQAASTEDDRRELFFGATYALGAGELRAAYGQGKVVNVDDSTARHWSLGYVYNLSKRTAVYTAVQEVRNADNLGYRSTGFSFDAIAVGPAAGAGVTARATAIGLRTKF